MNDALLVEVGGTHTRCARGGGSPQRVAVYENAEYTGLASVLTDYYSEFSHSRPEDALIAVAAPVRDGAAHLTNLDWTIDGDELARRFGLKRVRLVNDFTALACAVPFLEAGDLLPVKPGQVGDPRSTIAVIGPGTGLGVSGLLRCGRQRVPVCGEGGHVTLAASDAREAAIISRLRCRYGHVSAERALSGPGLLNLYELLCGSTARARSPSDVPDLAAAGDAAAADAMELFFGFLGTVSADLVLTLGARGGLYLGGGILPSLSEQLERSAFVARFTDKGRFQDYLAAVPVSLIVASHPALLGLARYPEVDSDPLAD